MLQGEQSNLGPNCLQFKVHKNINRLGMQMKELIRNEKS